MQRTGLSSGFIGRLLIMTLTAALAVGILMIIDRLSFAQSTEQLPTYYKVTGTTF
jgi:hypothetical protein